MSFEHRKYHWLYFVLGICLAVIVATMLGGCDRGKTDKGRDCWGMAGMSWQGEQCEVIDYPPTEPTDPPGCWYPNNEEFCEPEPPIACCAALTPECEACNDGCTVDEWMVKTCGENAIGVEYGYWDDVNNEPVWLCESVIID